MKKQDKVRICVIGPSLQMGGMERESVNMANAFNQLGHETLYLTIFRHQPFLKLNDGVHFSEPEQIIRRLNIFKTVLRLRRVLKKFRPDTVLAYNTFYASLAVLAAIGLGYPVFVRDGASPVFKWPWHVKAFFLLVFLFVSPTGVITQTSMSIPYQKKRYRKDVAFVTIPNILREVERYDFNREKVILAVGRVNDPLKGFDRLLEAFTLVRNKEWELHFAGGGENEVHHLEDQAARLGVQMRTKFLGKIKEIDRVYAGAGLFVMPSRSEGFPNALCEAMAAGLPCISFDFISGPRDIITDGINGYIIEDGNIEKMAEKIDYLILNPEEREKIGTNALEIRDRLNEKKIAGLFLEFMTNGRKNYV